VPRAAVAVPRSGRRRGHVWPTRRRAPPDAVASRAFGDVKGDALVCATPPPCTGTTAISRAMTEHAPPFAFAPSTRERLAGTPVAPPRLWPYIPVHTRANHSIKFQPTSSHGANGAMAEAEASLATLQSQSDAKTWPNQTRKARNARTKHVTAQSAASTGPQHASGSCALEDVAAVAAVR
jgi:hypothetical protein